ncbi:TetR/AcrR family transcriptional regulator (plasmid) [Paroceanicella profunda]|uniref:TetR/AcrR family transcriptional regulator n=1 Tax=Paroceanicella profunda TaxID=2579971 RepID=A0A5B8G064_9RHOB|nr:TetR/AcrR family transcriptional regulator [Paroceanicella profunda]QDL94095.1 TetR/AcrR family transcriptional regulator [Paroceanicella profunda]
MNATSTTSHRILASARELVIAGGYNGFSYADISKVVGIRKASIHHHFPAKSDLVRELVVAFRASAETGLAAAERDSANARAALEAYARHWEACIVDGHLPFCVCAHLATEMPVLPEDVAAEVRSFFNGLSAWMVRQMKRGVEDGSLRLSEPAATEAEWFIAAVHGAMLMARAQGRPELFAAIVFPSLRRLVPA